MSGPEYEIFKSKLKSAIDSYLQSDELVCIVHDENCGRYMHTISNDVYFQDYIMEWESDNEHGNHMVINMVKIYVVD